ncbi:MAG: lipopolysaccharide assembly protein LapA domain-containing protein [Candidatus Omnitrophica bacterium]|nr:lipopolysaccharide assembly protein LapA domain-containing protein [Candidatus Omnitrophota bacterium]
MKFKNILLLIFGIILLVVLLQNTQVVSMRFLFWQISMSRIILLPLVMFFGFVIGFFVGRKSRDWQ